MKAGIRVKILEDRALGGKQQQIRSWGAGERARGIKVLATNSELWSSMSGTEWGAVGALHSTKTCQSSKEVEKGLGGAAAQHGP